MVRGQEPATTISSTYTNIKIKMVTVPWEKMNKEVSALDDENPN
jgi:hypothetical protein